MASAIDPTLGGTLDVVGQKPSQSSMKTQLTTAAGEITAIQADTTAFLDMTDGISSYAGKADMVLVVNSGASGLSTRNETGHQKPGRTTPGDINYTLIVGTTLRDVHAATTLTAGRTWTLPTTNLYAGLDYFIIRTAGGAFDLTVTGMATADVPLGQNEGLHVYYDGSQWNVLSLLYLSASRNFRDASLTNCLLTTYAEAEGSASSSAGAITYDFDAFQVYSTTLTQAITAITLSNIQAGHSAVTLYITGAASPFAMTGWPASVRWRAGVAPDTTTLAVGQTMRISLTRRSSDSARILGSWAGNWSA